MKIKKTLTSGIIMIIVLVFTLTISHIIYGLFWDTPDKILVYWLTWQFVLSAILGFVLQVFIYAILYAVYNPARIKWWSAVKLGKDGLFRLCKEEPIKVKYRKVALIPLILTGIIPCIISFIWGIYPLMLLSVLMISEAIMDIKTLYHNSNLSPDTYVS
jgi:hypothetical protein